MKKQPLKWIKEFFTLVKMLFKLINKNDAVTVKMMEHFPFKGYSAMMWCGTIIVREEYAQFVDSLCLNHERIHLEQAKIKGSWIRYYIAYLWNWAKHNPFAPSSYYLNKYEGEAYANEHKDSYFMNYDGRNLDKYDLGRKYWRLYPSATQYKNYIKTIL